MKAAFVVLLAIVGLASAQQYFTTTEITQVKATGEYFFCLPLTAVPTGSYNLAVQLAFEHTTPIHVTFKDTPFKKPFDLANELAIHTIELKAFSGSRLGYFNEDTFKAHGSVSATVKSDSPLIKVIVAFQPQDPKAVKPITRAAETCASWLSDLTADTDIDTEPRKSHGKPMPIFAVISLSAGVILLVCSLLTCCCIVCRRNRNLSTDDWSGKALAPEGDAEMNVVTEQVPAIEDAAVHVPQPVAGAFYYIPAGAATGGQYAPMQGAPQFFVASGSNYPGLVVPQQL